MKSRLNVIMKPDSHTVGDGSYLIRSVYFDDPDDSSFYDTEDGTDPRAKYRLRAYNCDDSFIVLERKAKKRTMTHKDSERLTRDQAEMLLRGKIPAPDDTMTLTLRRMLSEMTEKAMKPSVIVQYKRLPYIERIGNVRVTLDTEIASSFAFDRFFKKDIPLRKIMPTNGCLLEVKWDQLLPDHIYDTLGLGQLQWSTFSKYYLCRKYNIGGLSV